MRHGRRIPVRLPRNAILLASIVWSTGCDEPLGVPTGVPSVDPPSPMSDPSNLQGQLAFVSGRDGNDEIYVVSANGSGLSRLTADTASDRSPVWSPDGSRIAFARGSDAADIYVMDADGSEVELRASGRSAGEPAWSPDGSTLAFQVVHDGSAHVATVGSSGSGADAVIAFLRDAPGYDGQPSWSPDGLRLAVVSDSRAYDFVLDVYTMNADGTDRVLRTPGSFLGPSLSLAQHPEWSPDATMIAFVHAGGVVSSASVGTVRFTVRVMSAEGTFIKDAAWAGDIDFLQELDPGSLTWSPDGRGIAYSFVDCNLRSGGSCSGARSVRYASLDGKELATIVSDAHSPSWRR